MARTGKERSLKLRINKIIAGVQMDDYPRVYDGKEEFSISGKTYPSITDTVMANMPIDDYESRLASFKAYIEALEQGLNINEDTIEGGEAYRENLTACPID